MSTYEVGLSTSVCVCEGFTLCNILYNKLDSYLLLSTMIINNK